MPFCTRCGKQAQDADRFCAACGSPLAAPPPEAPPAFHFGSTVALFTYSPTLRTAVYLLAVPVFLLLAGMSALSYPVDVAGVAFWAAVSGYVVIDMARNPPWRRWSAKFDSAGVRFRRGGVTGAYGYSQIGRVRRVEQGSTRWVALSFADPAAPEVFVPNVKGDALGVYLDEFLSSTAPAALAPETWPSHSEYDSLGGHLAKVLGSEEIKAVLLILLAELVATAVVSSLPFLAGEQELFSSILSQTNAQLSGASNYQLFEQIFVNNFRIALFNMVPGYGALPFVTSTYNTARVVEAIAISNGLPALTVVFGLVAVPHSWLELSAYPFAVIEGLYFVGLARSRPPAGSGRVLRVMKQILLSVVLVGGLLLVADAFEVGEIELGQTYSLLAWVPFLVLLWAGRRARAAFLRRGAANPLTNEPAAVGHGELRGDPGGQDAPAGPGSQPAPG